MVAALVGLACPAPPLPVPQRVVLVTIDTLRADHVGAYGAESAHTPHLDSVAARGVRFDAAVSPAPLTLPAHASLMTALDPPAHGVRHNSIYRLGADIPTLAERLRDAGYATAAFVGAVVLDRRYGLDRGFDLYDDDISGRRSGALGFVERPAADVVDAALAWLESAPPRFFLWVHLYDPHASYDPPAGFASAFASHPYAGEIAYVDAQLGRLFDGIRTKWGEEGLLRVVTSDHGESLGEHGEPTHAYTLYEATQRIPLLIEGPGVPPGRVVSGVVRLTDVAPTILSWTGARSLGEGRGEDLGPLIAGSDHDGRTAYMETVATQLNFGWSPLLGLRSGRFKYIRAPRPELYDLGADPDERIDLAPGEPRLVARLDRELEALIPDSPLPPSFARVSEAERARLRSLGYLTPGPPSDPTQIGQVGGIDPKDQIGVLAVLADAERALGAGRPLEALEHLEDLEDEGTAVASLRAVAALAAGRVGLAERAARIALRQQPERSDLLMVLARALEAQGRFEAAGRAYQAASALDPELAAASIGAARARQRERGSGATAR